MENPQETLQNTLPPNEPITEKMLPCALLRAAFCQMIDDAIKAKSEALASLEPARKEGVSEDNLLRLPAATDRAQQDILKMRSTYSEIISRMRSLAWPTVYFMPRPL
jgi:hypothetical protein